MSPTPQQIHDADVYLLDAGASRDTNTLMAVARLLASRQVEREQHRTERIALRAEVRRLENGQCAACAGRAA